MTSLPVVVCLAGAAYLAGLDWNDATLSKLLVSKNCFIGHHHLLPIGHKMRNNRTFDGKVDHWPPTPQKSVQELLAQL